MLTRVSATGLPLPQEPSFDYFACKKYSGDLHNMSRTGSTPHVLAKLSSCRASPAWLPGERRLRICRMRAADRYLPGTGWRQAIVLAVQRNELRCLRQKCNFRKRLQMSKLSKCCMACRPLAARVLWAWMSARHFAGEYKIISTSRPAVGRGALRVRLGNTDD